MVGWLRIIYGWPRSSRNLSAQSVDKFLPPKQSADISYHCTNMLHACSFCVHASKFYNDNLQVREPSLFQASNGMLVSGYAGKRQVKQDNRSLPSL